MSSNVVAAIDLGYGHVKFATRKAGQLLTDSFPSFVGISTGGSAQFNLDALGRLDVVTVRVQGRQYAVGKDSPLIRNKSTDRNRDNAYSTTDPYMALMMGALWNLQLPVIDVLVVGLPMTTFHTHAATLKARLIGKHAIPNFRSKNRSDDIDNITVTINEVVVLGQPVGALMDACGDDPRLQRENAVVLDMGFNTLDLLGMEGGKLRPDRTDAFPGGVASFIEEVARSVNEWVKKSHPEAPDGLRLSSHLYEEALRENKPLRTGLGSIDLQPHAKVATARLDQYLDQVATKLDSYGDITVAVLAGGGAKLIEGPFRKRFPLLKTVLIPSNPQFSVVRGFLSVGEAMAVAKEKAYA